MNKKEYRKALKTREWKYKRKAILKRDMFACTKCYATEELQVHHTYYLEGKMPWEVPNDCLITLCRACHEKEHEGRDIQSFVRKAEKKVKQEPKKNKKPPKVKYKSAKHFKFSKYVALKSKYSKLVFLQEEDWNEAFKKSTNPVLKGFDDKEEAIAWLKEKSGKKKK